MSAAHTASLQRRVTIGSAVCGTVLALVVFACDAAGLLQPLEWFLYDLRASTNQHFMAPPSDRIVHLEIDDAALAPGSIGRMPWDRSTWARLLDEIRLAEPKVVALDVLFSEPQKDIVQRDNTSYVTVPQDSAMVRALGDLRCAVLAESIAIADARDVDTALIQSAVSQLEQGLRMTPSELTQRLAQTFKRRSERDIATRIELDFIEIRRQAVLNLISRRLAVEHVPLEQIMSELAGAAASTSMPSDSARLVTTLDRVIENEYSHAVAELSLRRFSFPAPQGMRAAPPDGMMAQLPLPELAAVAGATGFVDYNFFKEAEVRSVPLFIRSGDRLYPQFGLVVACKMLGADPTKAQLQDDQVLIPSMDGMISIPVRARYSSKVDRFIGYILDIPWFGTSEWATMYDFPQHREIVRHLSMNVVWEVIATRDKIVKNNQDIDTAMKVLLLDDKAASEYAARKLTPDDFETRRQLAESALADLKASGYDELFKTRTTEQLDANERYMRDKMNAAREMIAQNTLLQRQFLQGRLDLKRNIGDRGVFVGAVATGLGDVVSTSLHNRCPGVVVHSTIVNAILNRDFLRTAPRWATLLLTLFFGFLATAFTSRMPPGRAVTLLALVAIAYFVINGLLLYDKLNLIVNAAAPLVAIAACWGGCMVVRLILEGVERIRLNREAAVIEHEISLARQVQAALIPKELKILTTVDSHGWTLAATTTGGDCFDLWKLADGRLGILVADASGHGLGPSIIVSEVRALVRALCDLYTEPQKLLDRINQRLASDLQGSKFCTTFVGFLSEDGKLTWGSAGHGPMVWCPNSDGQMQELEGTGLPLGVSEEWFGDPTVPVLELQPGGWLAVLSDGIFEAPDPGGEQFGTDRVKEALKNSCGDSCENVVATLRDAVQRWQVVAEPHDDQTIVVVRRSPVPATIEPDKSADAPDAAVAPSTVGKTEQVQQLG